MLVPVEESIRATEGTDKWRKYVHGCQPWDRWRLKNRTITRSASLFGSRCGHHFRFIEHTTNKTADSAPGIATYGVTLCGRHFLVAVYAWTLYVQAWCHKYSTRRLRPSRPWVQEIVQSVLCLQRVFLRNKPTAAYVWASAWRRRRAAN